MHKITDVTVLDDYRLDLTFDDGTRGVVDVSDLAGQGVFVLWDDYAEFREVEIGNAGELVWAGQVDLCPDSLYLKATGKEPHEVFPGLKHEPTHA